MAMIPAVVGFVLASTVGFAPPPWGFVGHEMAAGVAVAALPDDMPAFFRDAGPQLVHLNPEPDRWRVWEQREMDQAFSYDHYVDLENLPDGALDAPDRFEYLAMLYDAGTGEAGARRGVPARFGSSSSTSGSSPAGAGGGPRKAPERREWIEERIVNDAGVLGHYVTDASQPHHTTIHFNGWDLETPNPEGYTRDNQFHARFERFFVEAHVTRGDVAAHANDGPPRSVAGSAREAVLAHIQESHAEVETLYRLDRDVGFDPEQPADPAAKDFAAVRLAAGADMLAALWWSAWLESASPVERGGEDR